MAGAVAVAGTIVPMVGANSGESEPAAQVAEPLVVKARAPITRVAIPFEPVPEATVVSVYDVPLEPDLQLFVIRICEDHHIEPSVVIAVMERESRFRADAVGDSGDALGLMQIQPKWHRERMDRLGVTDLLNSYQNVKVGIDFLAELLDRYNGDIECALMAYNAGMSGARKYWFSKGIYSNAYSQAVMERSRFFREGMIDYVLD